MKDSTPKASSAFATSSWPAWMLLQPRWSWKAWTDVPRADDLSRIERDWKGWRGPAQRPPEGGDACGIVVAGRLDGRAYVLADLSVKQASPLQWAEAVATAARTFAADRVIVETNQGGEMVGQMLAFAGCQAAVTPVFARTSKTARAEPVALLYEKGRVAHCGAFEALEDEMMALGSGSAGASPDRADALVWAISHLMQDRGEGPRIRRL